MDHQSYSDSYLHGILERVQTIAVVGASANSVRPSYFVMKYLIGKGYRVVPINPGRAGGEILGQKVFASLSDVDVPVDMVDIFRPSSAVASVVDEALALSPRPKVIWMQLNVRDDQAAAKAEAAGLQIVMNRCPKIEYGRLSGEISWAGVNRKTVSSRRPARSGSGVQHLTIGGPRHTSYRQ